MLTKKAKRKKTVKKPLRKTTSQQLERIDRKLATVKQRQEATLADVCDRLEQIESRLTATAGPESPLSEETATKLIRAIERVIFRLNELSPASAKSSGDLASALPKIAESHRQPVDRQAAGMLSHRSP